MEHYNNTEEKIIDGQRLRFIRCDKNGNVLSDEELSALDIINPTIKSIVSEVSARISMGEEGAVSFRTL